MNLEELEALFANAPGDITIHEQDGLNSCTSRDFGVLVEFAQACRMPLIDLVTDAGNAVALVANNGCRSAPPFPSIAGDIYLGDGKPLKGQPCGVHLAPYFAFTNWPVMPRHNLVGLKIRKKGEILPSCPELHRESPCLADRTEEEVRHLLNIDSRCAVVFLGNVLKIAWSPRAGEPFKFISVRDAQHREANRIVQVKGEGGGTKTLKMFDEWMRLRQRREYNDVRFAPGENESSLLNLFTGFPIDPTVGDWSVLRGHLQNVVCGGNPEQFEWFMTYVAHMFQVPGDKPPSAIVIRGKKGTGKSIIVDFLQRLMPAYFCKVADGKRALSNFNAEYETALAVAMEEAFWAGDPVGESVLKDMITSPYQRVERKGADAYMARSYTRVFMLSNERWVVPATFDERRFAVFDCGDQYRGNIAYFKAMAEQMDAGGLEAMMFDLLNFKPKHGWDVLRTPPVTAGLREQMIDSLRGVDRFMFELAKNGGYECDACDEGGVQLDEKHGTSVSMTNMRVAVRDWLSDAYPGRKAATVDVIERAVREWFDAAISKRKAQKNSVRWIDFPPLAESWQHIRRTKGVDLGREATVH